MGYQLCSVRRADNESSVLHPSIRLLDSNLAVKVRMNWVYFMGRWRSPGYRVSLENCWTPQGSVGSNPTLPSTLTTYAELAQWRQQQFCKLPPSGRKGSSPLLS